MPERRVPHRKVFRGVSRQYSGRGTIQSVTGVTGSSDSVSAHGRHTARLLTGAFDSRAAWRGMTSAAPARSNRLAEDLGGTHELADVLHTFIVFQGTEDHSYLLVPGD